MIFNYSYPLRLRLACPILELKEPPYKDLIDAAVIEFNERSETAYNPKRIRDIHHLGGSEIAIVLDSSIELESPGRAIRLFSKILVEKEAFLPAIQHGKLFLSLPMIDQPTDLGEAVADVSPDQITDEALLTGLIHFFLYKSAGTTADYKKKRATVDLIKSLALKADLIDKQTLIRADDTIK